MRFQTDFLTVMSYAGLFFVALIICGLLHDKLKIQNKILNFLYILGAIVLCLYLSTFGASFVKYFQGERYVNSTKLKGLIVESLVTNGFDNSSDVLIISPKYLNKKNGSLVIVFHKQNAIDYRSDVKVKISESSYRIVFLQTEKNTSRHLGVPRKANSLWIRDI